MNNIEALFLAVLTWNSQRVKQWAVEVVGVDDDDAKLLMKEKIDGVALPDMTYEDFREYGVSGGASKKLFAAVKALFPERFLRGISPPPASSPDGMP